jgi:hypothetical protein
VRKHDRSLVGRTHELEVDETGSSLLTVRGGRIVRVQSFADPDPHAALAKPGHRPAKERTPRTWGSVPPAPLA